MPQGLSESGGTVRYHRADYDARLGDAPWAVRFSEDMMPVRFSAEQGEAMGLTPPEPAPLVVTCNGHSVELSDEEARFFAMYYPANTPHRDHFKRVSGAVKLARLLRDARQDPQPASDPASCPWCSHGTPCSYGDDHPERFVPQPAPADSDTLDFDAMPIGTVAEVTLLDGDRLLALKDGDGPDYKWYVGDSSVVDITRLRDVRVVYRPAPVSPAEGLRAVLAGRDDADELIEYGARHWKYVNESDAVTSVLGAVGDAARGGA